MLRTETVRSGDLCGRGVARERTRMLGKTTAADAAAILGLNLSLMSNFGLDENLRWLRRNNVGGSGGDI